jgi:hypothetical protein
MSSQKQKPSAPALDIADFRANLWRAVARNAKHLTGLQVVQALREISDDIYHAGVDSAYINTKARDPRNLADAWDLTWLTALNVKLLHIRRAKPHRRRKK